MEFVEIFQSILDAIDTVLKSPQTLHYLKIGAGIRAAVLLAMKSYDFARRKLLKKFKLFLMSDDGFWDSPPKRDLAKHARDLRAGCPVLTIVNFKGGVGKTTLAANLAAHFDRVGACVLLIDFDYQGSLTDYVILKFDQNLKLGACTVLNVDAKSDETLRDIERPVSHYQRTDILAAAYSLNRTENRMALRWLAGETRRDVRYALKDFLASRAAKERRYDIVIIDAPPRIMNATVNAITASTHVLVPTILDGLSVSAAGNTLEAIFKLRDRLSPSLEVIGIVPTFVDQATAYRPRELKALTDLRTEIGLFRGRQHGEIELFENERIARKSAIASMAHEDIAYFADDNVRTMFDTLGRKIGRRIGLQSFEDAEHEPAGPSADTQVARRNIASIAR